MIIYILYGLFAAGGALGCYLLMRPKLKQIAIYNETINQQNQELKEWNNILQNRNKELQIEQDTLNIQNSELAIQNQGLVDKVEQTKSLVQTIYDTSMSSMQDKLEIEAEKLGQQFQHIKASYEQEYADLQLELTQQFQQQRAEQEKEIAAASSELVELRAKIDAAIAAKLREEEKKNKIDFYRLVLPEVDIQEISYLRQVASLLRDQTALNKVIWKVYYEKPFSDLTARVLGPKIRTGIYKITNISNDKCYIGQAVNYWPVKYFTQ